MSGLLHVLVRGTNRSIDLRDGVRVCAGRSADCDIQIEDQSVSRHHASLQRRGDEIEVADLESANGTFVNERQVRTGWARAGDLIRLGTTVLEVREGAAGARTARLPRMGGDASTIESVISRRIEPSRFDWLSSVPKAGAELALLHDVGKIAVPDSILNKPERLTPDEYTEMKKHPLHGARILANIQSPAVKAVVPGVQYHHEKWDGSGYPEGLAAEQIPLLARVLGVSDFLDALTSARAYRDAMPLDEVVDLVKQSAGTHFDPAVADVVVRLHDHVVVRLHERGGLLPDDWTT